MKVFGVPYHVWTLTFFEFIVQPFGVLIHEDDRTKGIGCIDVARLLVRSNKFLLINEDFKVQIGNDLFSIFLVGDASADEDK